MLSAQTYAAGARLQAEPAPGEVRAGSTPLRPTAGAARLARAGPARVASYLATIAAAIAAGAFLDAQLGAALGWSSDLTAPGHLLAAIAGCLALAAFGLRSWGARSGELICAWSIAELLVTAAVAQALDWTHREFWDWWVGASVPLGLWLAGVALGGWARGWFTDRTAR
jgi:hypothetical protein